MSKATMPVPGRAAHAKCSEAPRSKAGSSQQNAGLHGLAQETKRETTAAVSSNGKPNVNKCNCSTTSFSTGALLVVQKGPRYRDATNTISCRWSREKIEELLFFTLQLRWAFVLVWVSQPANNSNVPSHLMSCGFPRKLPVPLPRCRTKSRRRCTAPHNTAIQPKQCAMSVS